MCKQASHFLDKSDMSDRSDLSRSDFAAKKRAAPRTGCGSNIRISCVYRLFHNFVNYITANTDVETAFGVLDTHALEVVVNSLCIVSVDIVDA